jgi:quercetin dioxygenase-like cupin family protein
LGRDLCPLAGTGRPGKNHQAQTIMLVKLLWPGRMRLSETMIENIATNSVGVDNGRVIRAFGQEAHVLVSSEQTGDAFCMLRISASPANVTPPHLHRATDETFLIESGEIEVNLGGELLRGRRGDVIYLPKGIPHAPRVMGNDDLTVVVVCVPAVLIVSLRLALKNLKKESLNCRFSSNWRLNMESSFNSVRRADRLRRRFKRVAGRRRWHAILDLSQRAL